MKISNEIKIALVAIAAVVVLFIGLHFLKGMSLFSSNDVYYVVFDDVSGLSPSSPIYANGYRVGVIKDIDYDYSRPDHIIATADLDPKLQMHKGTRAEIVSDFLGNVRLELRFGPAEGRLLTVGDTIEGGTQEGLMSKAANMLPQIEQMLPKLDSILQNINLLVSDPALAATMHNAEQLTARLTATSAQLHQLTAQLNRHMPQMMTKAEGVLANTETLTANLSQVDIEATMQRVDHALANVEQLTAKLNSPNGTVGMLLNDTQLYDHLNATMRDVDSLLLDFKSHPRRYINLSVFGKKDK